MVIEIDELGEWEVEFLEGGAKARILVKPSPEFELYRVSEPLVLSPPRDLAVEINDLDARVDNIETIIEQLKGEVT